ncbi:hypothetical protein CH262_12530 [Rhodococcus sp. 05-2255-1e]|nr:hypothetical protein CH262_12530 [Rhodococcus sp. 05-2255-1e]
MILMLLNPRLHPILTRHVFMTQTNGMLASVLHPYRFFILKNFLIFFKKKCAVLVIFGVTSSECVWTCWFFKVNCRNNRNRE